MGGGGGGEDKTETATPRKRSEARKRGQIAKSTEMSSIVVLLGLLLALHSLLGGAGHIIQGHLHTVLSHLDEAQMSPAIALQVGRTAIGVAVRMLAPLLMTAMALGIVVNMAQTGPLLAWEGMKPNFNKINPLAGFKRFVSPRSLVELVKSIYKIGLIGYITYVTLRGNYPQLLLLTRMDMSAAISVVAEVAYQMMVRIAITMLVLAALDYIYQRYAREKSLKRTKHEVKMEYKQQEGSPMVKQRVRARMRQLAKKRMMTDVPTADVIVTNPTHFAVALKYDGLRMAAPIVVAKGQDLMALKIRELAIEHDIPIIENPPLARALYKQTPIGHEIPGDLFEAVAEVMAFVYQINDRRRERMSYSRTGTR